MARDQRGQSLISWEAESFACGGVTSDEEAFVVAPTLDPQVTHVIAFDVDGFAWAFTRSVDLIVCGRSMEMLRRADAR